MTTQRKYRWTYLGNDDQAMWPSSVVLDYASGETPHDQEGIILLHECNSLTTYVNAEKYLYYRSFVELARRIHLLKVRKIDERSIFVILKDDVRPQSAYVLVESLSKIAVARNSGPLKFFCDPSFCKEGTEPF